MKDHVYVAKSAGGACFLPCARPVSRGEIVIEIAFKAPIIGIQTTLAGHLSCWEEFADALDECIVRARKAREGAR